MASKHLVLVLFLVSGAGSSVAQALQLSASAPGSPVQAASLSSALVSNAPRHAPDEIDFGTVADGLSTKETFSLTTNAPGYVTANIPPGPFRIVEFREMAPMQGAGRPPGGQSPAIAPGTVRSRIRYQAGQTGPFQWSMAPNVEVQLDIVFAPKIQGGSAGPRSAIMSLTGPGPHGNWALTIPLRGTLSNRKASLGPLLPKAQGNEQGTHQVRGMVRITEEN